MIIDTKWPIDMITRLLDPNYQWNQYQQCLSNPFGGWECGIFGPLAANSSSLPFLGLANNMKIKNTPN